MAILLVPACTRLSVPCGPIEAWGPVVSDRWGRPQLRHPFGHWGRYYGVLRLPSTSAIAEIQRRRAWVRVRGEAICRGRRQNPGTSPMEAWLAPVRAVSKKGFQLTPFSRPASWGGALQARWDARIERTLQGYPHLRALSRAMWLAEISLMPRSVLEWYQAAGLGHVLALSGQHVLVLAFLMTGLLRFLGAILLAMGWLAPAGLGYARTLAMLPTVTAWLLAALSGGVPSILRSAGLITCISGVRLFGFATLPLPALAVAVSVLLFWEPALAGEVGFWFSALATFWLIQLGKIDSTRWIGFLVGVNFFLPLLLFPLEAYFFSRISWVAPLLSPLWTPLWSLFWIPLGLLAPLGIFPEALLSKANALHGAFLHWQPIASESLRVTVIRPTAPEAVAWSVMLAILIRMIRRGIH